MLKRERCKDTPINYEIVNRELLASGINNIGKASIREIKRLIDNIEKATGDKFIRMEMGIPGLHAVEYGINAEIEALKNGVAAIYPDIDGIDILKSEISRFVKLFLDIDVNKAGCIPTVGSLQGSFASFMTVNRLYPDRDTILLINPGFPVHAQQIKILGQKYTAFDVYEYRGNKLRAKLEKYFEQGNIHSLLYSNPNNPAWICFTHDELKIIGELASKYGVIVMEDLAYIGMDFRKDYSKPGIPPFQPTIGKYTDKYILLISSSKAFSYAGQRIGMLVISDELFNYNNDNLLKYYSSNNFGNCMLFGTLYSLSGGTAHSAQYGLAAILKSVNDGIYNYRNEVIEYGRKAAIMKKIFSDNGFKIVYDKDIDIPIADGFYFTISYPGFTGEELLEEFLFYGISAISLSITGSDRNEGLRACVSLVDRKQFPDLEKRLKKFHNNYPICY
ncbi:MAG TPA: pyridoxal phosphate-dependent aminotransferase [Bacteroidales bacterium]|nr:pyridoxal phosphate-dependent aminotransferase [Bacteroidales bacterium]